MTLSRRNSRKLEKIKEPHKSQKSNNYKYIALLFFLLSYLLYRSTRSTPSNYIPSRDNIIHYINFLINLLKIPEYQSEFLVTKTNISIINNLDRLDENASDEEIRKMINIIKPFLKENELMKNGHRIRNTNSSNHSNVLHL